jgi:hypothetical protein
MRGLQEGGGVNEDDLIDFNGQLLTVEEFEVLLRMFALSMARTGHEAVTIERAIYPEHLTLQ